MKNLILISLIVILAWGCSERQPSKDAPDIIPKPLLAEMKKGNFEISRKTKILISPADEYLKSIAGLLQERIEFLTGKAPVISALVGDQPGNSILLKYDASISVEVGLEGYKLSVTPSGIVIRAPQAAGLFYGVQTIYQLLPPEAFSISKDDPGLKNIELTVPCLEMTDKPSFAWRGMHLDVSRHFFPKEFIKKYIDLIAMHKMNVFHWHLTDDNGWRIQIDQYPLLTEVAAWRADRQDIPWTERLPQKPGEPATYGGVLYKG
jgi:hexosaminidase